jgi:tRNA U34 5-methylaminomethyl-2-thiouridine-forming methyltransferase MnmC
LLEEFNSPHKFHVIFFDAFSPSEQPELWTEQIFQKMFDLLEDKGVLVTYCAQGQMKRNMKQVGFNVQSLPGALGKREMTRGLKAI